MLRIKITGKIKEQVYYECVTRVLLVGRATIDDKCSVSFCALVARVHPGYKSE